jgi:hypothetical protein
MEMVISPEQEYSHPFTSTSAKLCEIVKPAIIQAN